MPKTMNRQQLLWRFLALVVLAGVFVSESHACNVTIGFTSTDDPRGYGLVFRGDGAVSNRVDIHMEFEGSPSYHTWSGGPGSKEHFYGLDCRRIGTTKYRATAGCVDSQDPPIGNDAALNFEVVTPERPITFKAELLDSPQPAGNVLVSYEFNRSMRGPNISVPGGQGRFVSNEGPGSFIVNLPPGQHRLVAFWCFGGSNGEQSMAISVEVPEAAIPIRFELDDASSQDDRKVLIARHRTDAAYISAAQTNDARITIRAHVGVPGRRVYFRVIDPPDSAWYVPSAARHANDNQAGPGRLTLPSAVSDAEGFATSELLITGRYAGDNYQIEGSLDAAFSCGSGCARTAVLTAWKRVYLEKKRMFRAGASIVEARAGDSVVTVRVPRGVRFRPGDRLRFVHAPRLDGSGPRDFYSEDALIATHGVDRVRNCRDCLILTLTAPLSHTYTIDNSLADVPLSDGVGLLDEGFYERNESFVKTPFEDAFVQYLDVPQQLREVPYAEGLFHRLFLANKWFENSPHLAGGARPGDPNVKHVLAGSVPWDYQGDPIDDLLGQVEIGAARLLPSPNACWTFVENIEDMVRGNTPLRNFDAATVNGENVVHELAHTWRVNYAYHRPDDLGHCTKNMVDPAAMMCTMNSANDAQLGDGIVNFHWDSDADSEYMNIRLQQEPIPAP
ncbi:MAG TPA: hypothetical protein VGF48_06495 [Thermoanaerobaculia bacterium]